MVVRYVPNDISILLWKYTHFEIRKFIYLVLLWQKQNSCIHIAKIGTNVTNHRI